MLDESFSPWSSKKSGILSKYTTSAKLAIGVVRSQLPLQCLLKEKPLLTRDVLLPYFPFLQSFMNQKDLPKGPCRASFLVSPRVPWSAWFPLFAFMGGAFMRAFMRALMRSRVQ